VSQITTKSTIDVELIQQVGDDSIIARSAWVSTGNEGLRPVRGVKDREPTGEQLEYDKKVSGLLSYLMKHKHGSVFEHGLLTFRVNAPIFLWREHHRHRIGFCLSGDTIISPGSRNRTLKELHDRWKYGVPKSNGVGLRQLPSTHNFKLQTVNEDTNEVFINHAADVFESGVKEVLQLNYETGKRNSCQLLKCSKDHQIMTPEGWQKAGDLRKGDYIKIHSTIPLPNKTERIQSELRRAINNWTMFMKNVVVKYEDRCHVCKNVFEFCCLGVDHVVPVILDLTKALDKNNLAPICKNCAALKNASEQKFADRRQTNGVKLTKLLDTPNIVGEEMTYDIEVKGNHHNFLANHVMVHNSYNEESARYKTLDPVFYVPTEDRPMIKVDKWVPGRPKFITIEEDLADYVKSSRIHDENPPDTNFNELVRNLVDDYQRSYDHYLRNLQMDFDPGLARDGLNVGIYSSCWVTCNPRSLMAFLSLRTHNKEAKFVSYPLYEIEQLANQYEEFFKKYWPITHAAFVANGRVAP
jgi:thymidylate synthase ThyX/5-methylcytosine-specific restriction endonuclease McrA